MSRMPTAVVAAASLIAGFGVAVVSGSRPLGGVVLAVGGLWCVARWRREHGWGTAVALALLGLFAFAASHVLALAIGGWPSVLSVSAITALLVWRRADTRVARPPAAPPVAASRPSPGLSDVRTAAAADQPSR